MLLRSSARPGVGPVQIAQPGPLALGRGAPRPSRCILAVMPTLPARPRALASSPFRPVPEPVLAHFECADRVNHDLYGMGRVIGVEAEAITVNFGTQIVRIPSPYGKLSIL